MFTNIMRAEHGSKAEVASVLERLPVDDLGSVGLYRKELERRGFRPAKKRGLRI